MYRYAILILAVFCCAAVDAKPRKVQQATQEKAEAYRKSLLIPNVISGVDTAYPSSFQILNLEKEQVILFTVYNKWGSRMYKSNENNAAWDGTYKGKMQPDGEYGYKIQVKYEDGVTEEYQGVLMLVNNFKTKSM